ncbi:hypothetical protein TNCV_2067821 [Trichonephila clavipes]|uniref:Uncharacterized protein n=1 Tax=Trichonephila clavipes TaxID=2585209 RepID=A0A8X6W3L8_TRICX|nr:hypothetical protein TNCV_2067821 [Trichonephila clavipes]
MSPEKETPASFFRSEQRYLPKKSSLVPWGTPKTAPLEVKQTVTPPVPSTRRGDLTRGLAQNNTSHTCLIIKTRHDLRHGKEEEGTAELERERERRGEKKARRNDRGERQKLFLNRQLLKAQPVFMIEIDTNSLRVGREEGEHQSERRGSRRVISLDVSRVPRTRRGGIKREDWLTGLISNHA